jgi:hypothetical protein
MKVPGLRECQAYGHCTILVYSTSDVLRGFCACWGWLGALQSLQEGVGQLQLH